MPSQSEQAALGRDAIDALSLMFHHDHGEQMMAFIEKVDRDVPDWRRNLNNVDLPPDLRNTMRRAFAWDKGIKVLKRAKRL